MTFGIREKVSLLVILATAASALLVARGLADRAQKVLREHEIVDLGDEASLRGWGLSDKVDGLAEDLTNLVYSQEFHDAVLAGISADGLNGIAQKYCRRYWNDYLYVDIVHIHPQKIEPTYTKIHTPVELKNEDMWMPPPEETDAGQINFSQIFRLEVEYPEDANRSRRTVHEPVIWGLAPLNRLQYPIDGPQNFIRIAISMAATPSPRQFYVLENERGEQLQRHDEYEAASRGNIEVFKSFAHEPLLRAALDRQKSATNASSQSRVLRLVKKEGVKLKSPYYFLEGVPRKKLVSALHFEPDNEFWNDVREKSETLGRIGGLGSGVKEIRILADEREKVNQIRSIAETVLKEKFGDNYDGIEWRKLVVCDEIHVWAVQVLIGGGANPDRYLIHYAVMEDELASSIDYEMKTLRRQAILIAGGAGIVAFITAMLFILPLKRMTRLAQQVSDSKNLHEQLPVLVNHLKTRRRDEVGEIARASKRLFEELISSHDKLEQRVADRTADLRKVNFDLEQANVQLKSLSHEKDAFVAKVSHDLRQPLNAIFLQVEALKLSELDDVQKDDVQKIHSHATRELNLVNDILEYQKIIMGAETLRRNEIDIATLVDDLNSIYCPSAEEKGIELVVNCENPGEMVADDRRLRQVLGNLLGNACKFTKEGKVTLHVEPRKVNGEDWVEFAVSDTGRGMSPEEQSKAFVPFVSNKKDNAGGTGLGLSICKELTERMGGKIGFVSELGSGTSFTVLMPRKATSEHYEEIEESEENEKAKGKPLKPSKVASTAEEAAKQIARHAEGANHSGGKVLVIDDDPSVRDLLKRLLEGDGYVVLTAENGDEGIEMAKTEKPDAITLDVVMPGTRDGWAVLKELKALSETEGIPVIMVSIMAEADNGFALDVEDYLVKPVDIDRLSRVVSRVTQSSLQRNLLIVDDEVDTREALARLLKESGWESSFASHGKEALAVLEKTRPAAIVLDLMMPEMDGFEFLRIIQDDEQLASIPVIVMTGKEPTEEERIFLEKRVGMILKKGEDSGSRKVLKTITQRIRPTPG